MIWHRFKKYSLMVLAALTLAASPAALAIYCPEGSNIQWTSDPAVQIQASPADPAEPGVLTLTVSFLPNATSTTVPATPITYSVEDYTDNKPQAPPRVCTNCTDPNKRGSVQFKYNTDFITNGKKYTYIIWARNPVYSPENFCEIEAFNPANNFVTYYINWFVNPFNPTPLIIEYKNVPEGIMVYWPQARIYINYNSTYKLEITLDNKTETVTINPPNHQYIIPTANIKQGDVYNFKVTAISNELYPGAIPPVPLYASFAFWPNEFGIDGSIEQSGINSAKASIEVTQAASPPTTPTIELLCPSCALNPNPMPCPGPSCTCSTNGSTTQCTATLQPTGDGLPPGSYTGNTITVTDGSAKETLDLADFNIDVNVDWAENEFQLTGGTVADPDPHIDATYHDTAKVLPFDTTPPLTVAYTFAATPVNQAGKPLGPPIKKTVTAETADCTNGVCKVTIPLPSSDDIAYDVIGTAAVSYLGKPYSTTAKAFFAAPPGAVENLSVSAEPTLQNYYYAWSPPAANANVTYQVKLVSGSGTLNYTPGDTKAWVRGASSDTLVSVTACNKTDGFGCSAPSLCTGDKSCTTATGQE